MAGLPERAAAADDHLLGTGRHLLHARRGRVLSQGSTQSRDASTELRPFRRRGLLADHRRQDEGLLSTRSGRLIGARNSQPKEADGDRVGPHGDLAVFALAYGLAFTLPAFAQTGDVSQQKTREDCDKVWGYW